MRTLALLVCTTLASSLGLGQGNPELLQLQTVYLMPMANGFDQYLANGLRGIGQFRIVTDAFKADAIFTDKIGPAFESRLDELETLAKEKALADAPVPAVNADPTAPVSADKNQMKFAPKVVSTIGRGRGTYFLVDRRSRTVLWSTFQTSKDAQPKSLNEKAKKISGEFAKELGVKTK